MKAVSAKKVIEVPGHQQSFKLMGYEQFYKFDIYPHYLYSPTETEEEQRRLEEEEKEAQK